MSINNEIKAIRSTYDELNKKDTLTADEIKMINNSLTSALKCIETTTVDFNKTFIDIEELQSEILKFNNKQSC